MRRCERSNWKANRGDWPAKPISLSKVIRDVEGTDRWKHERTIVDQRYCARI